MPERRTVWSTALRHDLLLLRRGTLAWTLGFAASAAAIVSSYTKAYPTDASRRAVAALIEGNHAFAALYGVARRIDTLGGFAAWRLSALSIVAAIWGLLAGTRLLRGEEESGRWELVVAGSISRAGATAAALAALGVSFAIAWVALVLVLVATKLALGGAMLLGLQVAGAGALFAAGAAVTSQLVPVRRRAAGLAGFFLGGAVLLRVVADGTETMGWLRPLTPFGWIEELRPFSGSELVWLLPLVVSLALLCWFAVHLAAARDLGAGSIWSGDTGRSSTRLLGSAVGFTARESAMPAAVWALCLGTFGAVLGLLAVDVASFAARSPGTRAVAGRFGLGGADIGSAAGFIGLAFGFMVVGVCLFAAFRLQAVHEEEAAGRLDNLLTRAVGRRGWIGTQAVVATGGSAFVAVATASTTWVAAVSRGAHLSFAPMLGAALNLLPVTVLFLGIGVLAFGAFPRAAPAVMFGAIAGTYLLQLVGAFASVPRAVLDLSPFHHVAPAPAVSVRAGSALVMTLIGVVCAVVGTELFAHRDVVGA